MVTNTVSPPDCLLPLVRLSPDRHWPLGQDETGGAPASLPERIRALRTENSWSQADLAERVDAEQAQVSRYESGRAVPSLATVVRLAEALGVCTDYLLLDDAPTAIPLR